MNLSPSDLIALRSAVCETVERSLSPWRTRAGAAAYLQCSIREIDEQKATGALPCKYRGSVPLFNTKDLDAILTARKS